MVRWFLRKLWRLIGGNLTWDAIGYIWGLLVPGGASAMVTAIVQWASFGELPIWGLVLFFLTVYLVFLKITSVVVLTLRDEKQLPAKELLSPASLSPPELSPAKAPYSAFTIKMRTRELRWRAPGEDKDHPFTPIVPVPYNASFILYVVAEIAADPARLVEEIGLEFMGKFLPSREGKTEKLSHIEKLLCFDISGHTPAGEHQVRLTARTSWNGVGTKEEKSQYFTVHIPHPSKEGTD